MKKLVLVLAILAIASTASAVSQWTKWNTFGGLIWYPSHNAVMVYIPILNIDTEPIEINVSGIGTMVGKWSPKYGYYFAWLTYDQWLKFKKKTKKQYWNVKIRSYTSGLRYKGKLIRWINN